MDWAWEDDYVADQFAETRAVTRGIMRQPSGDEMAHRSGPLCLLLPFVLSVFSVGAVAQPAPGSPPAVGVVRAERQQITQTEEFIGRIQSIGRVALVARVSAFLEKRPFVEGSEVKRGDLLYLLEQPPFQAQVDADKANVEQLEAQHTYAEKQLERAQYLLKTPAGDEQSVDQNLATERSLAAQVAAAQAQLEEAEINLGYTEIRAPIDGRISATEVTEGNVVSPSSGTLANLVSQDPMYVRFPVSTREGLDLRNRYEPKGGFNAAIVKLRLPDGRIYGQDGKLDYVSPTIATNTDTVTVRAVVSSPLIPGMAPGGPAPRELFDGEFVTLLFEGVEPITVLTIPRAAVLSNQQGDYVYVVDAQNKAQRQPIQLGGQSTPSTGVVASGLTEGELVVSEGVQRVHPGEVVSPGPATPLPEISPEVAEGGASGPSSSEPKATE